MQTHYDLLIVGSGLYGAVVAHEAMKRGKRCLVLEKRDHTGGNVACEMKDNICIHRYGAHIFHTSNERVWQYVNDIVPFMPYINSPMANYHGQLYHMPFNMYTFRAMWGVETAEEAKAKIEAQRGEIQGEPRNLEEQAISLVGRDIYEKLIRGYTEKQWGRDCRDLPAFIIRRLPVRFTYDNNYFNDPHQGLPEGGYNRLIEGLLAGAEIKTGVDFLQERQYWRAMADQVVYTGMIDAYFDYCYGELGYRSLRFEFERMPVSDYQGMAVMNYTAREVPYTRIIEFKHFDGAVSPVTHIAREYPMAWQRGEEGYYPINDAENQQRYQQYAERAQQEKGVHFGGRLGAYQYYDMDKTIAAALQWCDETLS